MKIKCIKTDLTNAARNTHFKYATKDLNQAIEREVSASQFRQDQLKAIRAGESTIPDLTWHHHENVGRMHSSGKYSWRARSRWWLFHSGG